MPSESENEKREKLADIVAQMRGRGEDGRMDRHLWNEYADRIEAAAKRVVGSKTETTTVGNAAATREVLDAALSFIGDLEIEPYSPLDEAASELRKRIMDALAAPARQCDVGTADEQANRFGKLCGKYYNEEEPCNEKCPLASLPIIHGFPRCQAYWAQLPYDAEKGGKA